jgi:hypothetical protein
MSTASSDVIEVSAFPARRYRLSSDTSRVTVLAFATVDIAWVRDRLRIKFVHGHDHYITTSWTEDRKPGEWITIEGWAPPRMPPIPTDGLWHSLRVRVQLSNSSSEGFVGYRERTPGPGYLVSRTVPPTKAGIELVEGASANGAGVAGSPNITNQSCGDGACPLPPNT